MSIFLLKGAFFTAGAFLYAISAIELHHLFLYFMATELLIVMTLMTAVRKKKINLPFKYVLFESWFYLLFWGAMILAQLGKVKFIFACLFLFLRLVTKLHFYCNCEESMDENDLEIFFKVGFDLKFLYY